MFKFGLISISFFISGCFPMYIKETPSLTLQLQDSNKKPIQDSKIILQTRTAGPLRRDRVIREEIFHPDRNGIVVIPSKRKWELFILAPDAGSPEYFWTWCSQSIGYKPHVGMLRFDKITIDSNSIAYSESQVIPIQLSTTDKSYSGCEWLN